MMWPDAIIIYCMKGLIHYTTAYPDIATGRDAFLNDWGVILLVSGVVLWVFKEFYHLFFEPILSR